MKKGVTDWRHDLEPSPLHGVYVVGGHREPTQGGEQSDAIDDRMSFPVERNGRS